ncbi:GNAT family N-acetyltransferase [Lentzea sp.]|uniref:GNAT family N-acetyltransferase n=1 Tax=Lentzea sp. TaxID=56099 RepID=UPI002ED5C499
MGDWTVRPARLEDLASLTWRLGQGRYFTDRLDRQSRGLGVLLTAWRAGVVLGVVYVWLEIAEEPEIRRHLPDTPLITHLEVHPQHRGEGIGRGLIGKAEELLAREGHRSVALAVEVNNGAAANLYKSLGFRNWRHGLINCYSLGDVNGHRRVEVCAVMTKSLTR